MSLVITTEIWSTGTKKALQVFMRLGVLLVGSLTIWLFLRVEVYLAEHQEQILPETQFASYRIESARLKAITCGQKNVLLAYYPGGIYYYWFTNMKPVSKYIFMWPWVAEIGLNDTIGELNSERILAIVVRNEGRIWGKYDTRDYLHRLDGFLNRHYKKISEGVYLSPELSRLCLRREQNPKR